MSQAFADHSGTVGYDGCMWKNANVFIDEEMDAIRTANLLYNVVHAHNCTALVRCKDGCGDKSDYCMVCCRCVKVVIWYTVIQRVWAIYLIGVWSADTTVIGSQSTATYCSEIQLPWPWQLMVEFSISLVCISAACVCFALWIPTVCLHFAITDDMLWQNTLRPFMMMQLLDTNVLQSDFTVTNLSDSFNTFKLSSSTSYFQRFRPFAISSTLFFGHRLVVEKAVSGNHKCIDCIRQSSRPSIIFKWLFALLELVEFCHCHSVTRNIFAITLYYCRACLYKL